MCNFLPFLNGLSYRHVDLEGFIDGLYRDDRVHLSDVGFDICNVGLQNMVRKICGSLGGHANLAWHGLWGRPAWTNGCYLLY